MRKKLISGILAFSVLITCLSLGRTKADSGSTADLEPYMVLNNHNLSFMDLKGSKELLSTISFSSRTKWPTSDKLPSGFDPKQILEYGKDPGLGISELHKLGYTGKGVSIAYIDQPLLLNHIAYRDTNVRYYIIRPDEKYMTTSMHGPGVLSLLAGKETGIAPDSKVYFFGHPAWLTDQTTHAEALRKLMEVNQTLSAENKIRIVGFSDAMDPSEKNVEEFRKAAREAEDSGIMVFDVNTINVVPLVVKPFKDKNDPASYEIAQWAQRARITADTLFVPSSGRTAASGASSDPSEYVYWTNAGLSWSIPYIVGTIALGMQIDPKLTKENAIKYLKESAYSYRAGGIINPTGFLKLVAKNCRDKKFANQPGDSDYSYVLYNSKSTDAADLAAIRSYCGSFGKARQMILKDTSGYNSAAQIYRMLKEDFSGRAGCLKGIQIIGTSAEVPAFDIRFKIQMQSGIDDSGHFKSDFFYSTFANDEAVLQNDFSIYKNFNEKLNASFIAEWPVVRLPLAKGEIAGFIKKHKQYADTVKKLNSVPLVNFSNPIFASKTHSDDMGYFIKERLDKTFAILDSSRYRLYGNKQGLYPVTTDVLGDFTQADIKAENERGIADFFINSHGQQNNIDRVVFEKQGKITEKRSSFLNSSNINQVLSGNFYTLTTWTCLNAYGLGSDNLLHEALAKGKCVGAIGASSIISNNGVNNKASLGALKKNNFYYFQYVFFESLMDGYSRSDSFFLAQRAYAREILKNTNMLGEGNYQFNLHNILSNHNLGLLENWDSKHRGLVMADTAKRAVQPGAIVSSPANNSSSRQNTPNPAQKGEIEYHTKLDGMGVTVNSVKYEKAGESIQFIFDFDSSSERGYSFFNPPEGSVVRIMSLSSGVRKGNNVIKLGVEIKKLKEISNLTFKFIDNPDTDNFISFATDQLDGQ